MFIKTNIENNNTYLCKFNNFRLVLLSLIGVFLSLSVEANKSAYPIGPLYKNGYYHMIWMWRATESAATNSMLSYGRSKDLVEWDSCGKDVVEIPISPNEMFLVEEGKTKVKEKTIYEGLVNNRQNLSLIGQDVVVSYVHNDENGSQIINAKKEGCEWIKSKITNNCEKIDIDKSGSLDVTRKITFSRISKINGKYTQTIKNLLRPCGDIKVNGTIELNNDYSLKKIKEQKDDDDKINSLTSPSKYLTVKKTLNVKGAAVTWFAKENIGDLRPACYPRLCNNDDFSSPIYIKIDNKFIKIKEAGKPIKVWGGAQAQYSYLKLSNDEGFLAFYDAITLCLNISKIKGNELKKTHCLERNKNKWDSHNYIIMRQHRGLIYVTGNTHNDDVNVYSFKKNNFENEKPRKIFFLKGSYTYPKFIFNNNDVNLFVREGKSGNGSFMLFDIKNEMKNGKRIFTNG
ncbi:MAG: hypothetical protein GY738_05645 [Pseudoalteromonas sp.]|nr:hypothetical protein [Pseudoalteromonas sp.]